MSSTTESASLLDYLRLIRAPNVFTAAADVLMGFALATGGFRPEGKLALLIVASCLLYMAGMVLNDVFDVEIDLRERPERPLPSGRIRLGLARRIGFMMLVIGAAFGWAAGWVAPVQGEVVWRSGAVASLLAVAVWAYDAVLKRTWLGPVGMGTCRFLNVLLGISGGASGADGFNVLGFGLHHLAAAGGIGVYIVGVTWFARSEAESQSPRGPLAAGCFVMFAGIGLLALFPEFLPASRRPSLGEPWIWWALLVMLAVPIARRCFSAVMNPSPQIVQQAVKMAILSLILFDAAVALHAASMFHGVVIVALLAPTLLLGRWVYST